MAEAIQVAIITAWEVHARLAEYAWIYKDDISHREKGNQTADDLFAQIGTFFPYPEDFLHLLNLLGF
jgi:hypothetical protein